MGFVIFMGVLLGAGLAAGIAFIICASSLSKSNDFGDTAIPIDTYCGYTPPNIEYVGNVSNGGFGLKNGIGGNFNLW